MNKSKTGCVILNYNDAETTIEQIERIRRFEILDRIVIVDNKSTDNSFRTLEKKCRDWNQPGREKILLLQAERNGGYGAGNNLGLRYCVEKLDCTYVLIANPDTEFEEQTIKRLKEALKKHENGAVSACVMKDGEGRIQGRGWRLLPWYLDLLSAGPVCRRIFSVSAEYPEEYFQGKQAVKADAVHGSMLFTHGRRVLEAGGYDEKVFLYEEEVILGSRLKKMGFETIMLPKEAYIHRDSVSTSKNIKGLLRRQKIRRKSTMYYYKEYLKCRLPALAAARVFLGVIEAEVFIWEKLLHRQ